MANPNNSVGNWKLEVDFELNHEKGKCEMKLLTSDGSLIESMRYVQGMYVDKGNHLMNEDDREGMKWLLRKLGEIKPDPDPVVGRDDDPDP